MTEFTPTIISVEPRTGKGRDSVVAGSATLVEGDSAGTPIPDKLRLYEQIIHRLPAALYTCDAEGRVMLYNQAAASLWGRAPLIGQDRWCGALRIFRTDGEPMPLSECPMAVTLRTGKAVEGKEIIIERPDGSRRNVLPHPELIRADDGTVLGAVNMLVDITDVQVARRSEQLLSAIVESSDDAIISMTLDGRISSWNTGARSMYGYEAAEAVGRPVSMLIPEDRLSHDADLLQRIRQGERIEHFETTRMTRDGRRIEVSLTISPIRDHQGSVIGASKIARDVTDRNKVRRALREMQERFARFMQHLPGLAWIKDHEGRYVYANEAAEEAFQVTRAKLYGRRDDQLFPQKTAEAFRANDDAVHKTGTAVESIETLEHEDGLHHSLVTKFPIPSSGNSPDLVGGVAIDVTDRLIAEQSLRDSELRFRTVAMNAPAAIYIKDVQGRYLMANPLACRALGRSAGVIGLTDHDLLRPDLADELNRNDQRVIASGAPMECEEIITTDGGTRSFLSVKFPMADGEGRTVGVCGVAVDITDRKLAERSRREAQEQLQLVTDSMTVVVARCSADYRFQWVNRGCAAWFGLPEDQIIGRPIREIMGEAAFETVKPRIDQALRGERVDYETLVHYDRVGPRWIRAQYVPTYGPDGKPDGWVGVVADLTQRKQTEEALRESEERFRTLADGAPVLIWVNDLNGCEFVNQAYLQFTGKSMEDVLGMRWTSALHPDDAEKYQKSYAGAVAKRGVFDAQMRFRGGDGEYRWMRATGIPRITDDGTLIGYIGCSTDITDQIKAREALELQQSLLEEAVASRTAQLAETNQRLRLVERMASLGTLSAGLGHDMGNLLVPLQVRLDSLAASPLTPLQQEDVNAIRTAAEYLQRLSSGLRLLSISPQRERSTDMTELLAWWQDVSIVLKNAIPQGVELKSSLPARPCGAGIPRAALTQVVFNLVQNAGDAIRRGKGGTISVEVESGDTVVTIRVSDDGPGMSDEVRQHCMEPFYTTKPRGMSTGLGLVLVYGLVRDAGGTVNIESAEGKGTSFIIELPARQCPIESGTTDKIGLAFIQLQDKRLQAFMAIELRHHKYDVTNDETKLAAADLVVTSGLQHGQRPRSRAKLLIMGDGHGQADSATLAVLPERPSPQLIRETLRRLSAPNIDPQEPTR